MIIVCFNCKNKKKQGTFSPLPSVSFVD